MVTQRKKQNGHFFVCIITAAVQSNKRLLTDAVPLDTTDIFSLSNRPETRRRPPPESRPERRPGLIKPRRIKRDVADQPIGFIWTYSVNGDLHS